jgi:hypothetical protein
MSNSPKKRTILLIGSLPDRYSLANRKNLNIPQFLRLEKEKITLPNPHQSSISSSIRELSVTSEPEDRSQFP